MDDLLRMIAMGLVDEWVRNGIANRQSSLHLFAQHPGNSSPVRLGASQVRRQTIQQRSLAFAKFPRSFVRPITVVVPLAATNQLQSMSTDKPWLSK